MVDCDCEKLTSKGIVLDGNIVFVGTSATISSHGRLALSGNEDLYLLFPNNVVVSKSGGKSGNLSVEGSLTVTENCECDQLAAKGIVLNGNIVLAGPATISSPGRLALSGNEDLYLLFQNNVVVSKSGGMSGNLSVEGSLTVEENINVKGDVLLENADCAEDFDIIGAESIEPGTVMVIDNEGALRASEQAYDKRVAGVISGAGTLRPGILLDRQTARANRLPLALTGKVYCKVDAEYSSIDVGDLLTTSPNIGYAMKVSDPFRSIGAIIGKALRPLKDGQDLIPILVALQ
jgi:cytoskeletal protein CcmA (bactofilin family)